MPLTCRRKETSHLWCPSPKPQVPAAFWFELEMIITKQRSGAKGGEFKGGFGNTYFAKQRWEQELSVPPATPGLPWFM